MNKEKSETSQRAELHSKIWKIADNVRGAVDGWDFKQYILGTLFYRFISEDINEYISDEYGINYEQQKDSSVLNYIIDDTKGALGYFIYPSQLFSNVVKDAANNPNLNTELANIFKDIESTAVGTNSEDAIKGLFDDIDTTSNRLGSTVNEKNKRIVQILKGIEELDLNIKDNKIDLFGDAYEFLISNYAKNAGKSGGEFFTPQTVSKLVSKLVTVGVDKIETIYDPTCGSGSLLLQMKKHYKKNDIKYYGQEINMTTFNLARMNMFLHRINFSDFSIKRGDTLIEPAVFTESEFDAIVSNPPYSTKWIGEDDPTLINDERFAPAGKLAPKSKADYAFIMHSLKHLGSKGKAAIVTFPGIFYRQGAEKTIRKYLVEENYIDTIIQLPENLFFGTSIATCILVLSKSKEDNKICFIDASKEYIKETNNNILTEENIDDILKMYADKKDIEYKVKVVDNSKVKEEDYNLSVSTYVEKEDLTPKIDITELNKQIKETVIKQNKLREEINKIVFEIEGTNE
jgi:type I restriction enzyme M protein